METVEVHQKEFIMIPAVRFFLYLVGILSALIVLISLPGCSTGIAHNRFLGAVIFYDIFLALPICGIVMLFLKGRTMKILGGTYLLLFIFALYLFAAAFV